MFQASLHRTGFIILTGVLTLVCSCLFFTPTALAWNISTVSYDDVSLDVTSEDSVAFSISFSADGSKMHILGADTGAVYQYTLSTPWDLSTADYDEVSYIPGEPFNGPQGFVFSTDGTKMYVLNFEPRRVFEMTLSTPWDISSADFAGVNFNPTAQSGAHRDLFFKPDGTKMFILTNDTIYQYTLSTPWDLSTVSYDDLSYGFNEDEIARGFFFKDDGTKLYLVGSNNTIYQYTLSTPWDVEVVSYDDVSHSVVAQASTPQNIFFKGGGDRLYVISSLITSAIYQYSVTPPVNYDEFFASGEGTEGSPYVIENYEQWQGIAQMEENEEESTEGIYFALGADIEIEEGYESFSFYGNLDGDGHVFTGLTTPLFSDLAGDVESFIIQDSHIVFGVESDDDEYGLLARYVNGGTVEDVTVSGSIMFGGNSTCSYIGGLVGYADGGAAFINVHAHVDIQAPDCDYVGGLLGSGSVTISNSSATGDVSGDNRVGGFVGHLGNNGTIHTSYAIGDVTGGDSYIGGFLGYMHWNASAYNTYARGSVTSNSSIGSYVGGYVGLLEGGDVFYSYATGDVILTLGDTSRIGGFAGAKQEDSIYSSYTVSTIVNYETASDTGGFIGLNEFSPGHYNAGWWTSAGPADAIGKQNFGEPTEPAYAEADRNAFKNPAHELYNTDWVDLYNELGESYNGGVFNVWDFDDVWAQDHNINDGWPYLLALVASYGEDGGGEPEPILGCTDSSATNYNPSATQSNGTCTYPSSGGGGSSSGSRSGGGSTAVVQQPAQTIEGIVNQHRDLLLQAHGLGIALPQNILNLLGIQATTPTVRDLEYGMEGEDVRQLQTLLIGQGYSIPAGATSFFLEQTRSALSAYQSANSISPAVGYFGPITRAQMKAAGLTGLWW